MGEASRLRGTLGENIVKGFLDLIGWNTVSNFDIKCSNHKKHNRGHHGIDYFTTYNSPVESNLAEVVLTSAKYLKDISRNEVIQEIISLDQALQCLQLTDTYNDQFNKSFHSSKKHHLIFFCLLDKNKSDAIKKTLQDITSNENLVSNDITIIDNKRAEFIYDSISFTKMLYPKGKIEFFYHPTGVNDQLDKGLIISGDTLPIEFITSNMLPFRVKIEDRKVLVLFINENFEKSSLKRSVALCQRLTLDWCNKVQICFPDYQLLKHKTIKETVFMSFEDKEFMSIVEVKNYHNTLISLEDPETIIKDFIPTKERAFNAETLLPQGDMLRQLLIESYIGKREINQLLNRRGVFPNKLLGKQDLIPYLSKSLLSPTEFEFLRSKQANAAKQPVENFKSEELNKDIVSDANTAFMLSKQKIKQLVQNKYPNCSFAKDISITTIPNGGFSIKYDLNVKNSTKDWTKQETIQHGEIIFNTIETNDEKSTQIESISDSKIIENVSNVMKKQLLNELKKTGVIAVSDKVQKIHVSEFTRPMRNEFLLSFVNNNKNESNLKFAQISYIDFTLDEDADIFPDELLSLKNQLEEAEFKGKNLENTVFVQDKRYRNSIIFYAFVCEYFFACSLNEELVKGKVDIEFGFPDMKDRSSEQAEKAEFMYKIKNINPFIERILNDRECNEIKGQIKKSFDLIRSSNVKKYLTSVQLDLFIR